MTVDIRPAKPTDAGTTGEILEQFQNDTLWMPKLHTGAEMISYCGSMIDEGIVRVITRSGRVKGFIAQRDEEVLSLYLHATARGQGLGSALLRDAKARSQRLTLWTFQANLDAQGFYRRHGFSEVGRTDGDNDEGLPDIRYEWTRAA